jgi:lysophospholipase L1-like esterase
MLDASEIARSKDVTQCFARRKKVLWCAYLCVLTLGIEALLQGYYSATTGTFLFSREKPPLWATDISSGWTNQPNLQYRHVTPEFEVDLHTNSQGFRVSSKHEEYQVAKSKNTYRILLLGPSFTFGWGVNFEDTFGAQLQHILAQHGYAEGQKIEVLNHGVPAWPAAHQLEWFRRMGKDYSPDLVLHFAYGSMETPVELNRSVIVANGALVSADATLTDRAWAFAKNIATVFYTGVAVGKISQWLKRPGSDRLIEGAGRTLKNLSHFDPRADDTAASLSFYRAFSTAVQEAGAEFAVVYFPLAYVVYPEDRARWAIHGVEDIEGQIEFNRAFTSYLRNNEDISTLNLTDDLIKQARGGGPRLYYWLDVHWTPLAHRRSAEAVGNFLLNPSRK